MCLTKIPTYDIFKITVGYNYISKYAHCDMRFLDVKIGLMLCFLNVFGIAVRYLFIRHIQHGF